ncbi:MAG TPA: amidohydrolase family protein [Hanamia sp.]|jgi:imidazolonepropionase-like amidohydrolase|nr:amidohydrolase family protein [Hanamia sp.]
MKSKILFIIICLFTVAANAQTKFSAETEKYIVYNEPVTVFKDALLIDGTGNAAKPHQTIIISNGKIDWVGDDAKASIPKGAKTIDLSGKALMPGLVMTHEHMYISAFSRSPQNLNLRQVAVTFPRLYLACGATTIRTTGCIEPYSDIRIKKDIDAGVVPGPSIDLTAPYLQGKESQFEQMNELKGPPDAVTFVNYWADQGFTSFKGYMNIDQPTLKAAIDAAHKRNLKVTAHLCAVTYREAAEMGIDHLEHGFFASTDFVKGKKENACPAGAIQSLATVNPEGDSAKSLMQFLINKKVGITSTLAVFEDISAKYKAPSEELLEMFSPDNRDFFLKEVADIQSLKATTPQVALMMNNAFTNNAKMEKMFYDMGGLLSVGTDPTGDGGIIAGMGNWRAIELLVEADGFTPLQAIKIATLNGAITLGFEKNIGTIEVGKNADLLIIDGDPSKNISDLRKVEWVFKNGVGYDSKKMFESVKGKVGFY